METPSALPPQGWSQTPLLRQKLFLERILGSKTLAVYDIIRSKTWRNASIGPDVLRDMAAQDRLAAQLSLSEIALHAGVGRGRVREHTKYLSALGWLTLSTHQDPDTKAYNKTIYLLGDVTKTTLGKKKRQEIFYATTAMQGWYSDLDALCQQQQGTPYAKMKRKKQYELAAAYIESRVSTDQTEPKKHDRLCMPTQQTQPVVLDVGGGMPLSLGGCAPQEQRTGGIVLPYGGVYPTQQETPSKTGLESGIFGSTCVGFSHDFQGSGAHPLCPNGVHPPSERGTPPLLVGVREPLETKENLSSPKNAIHNPHTKDSYTSLRSPLRTSYSESSYTQCTSSGLTPRHVIQSGFSLDPREQPEEKTLKEISQVFSLGQEPEKTPEKNPETDSLPVPLTPPSLQPMEWCVIGGRNDGDTTMAFRRTETGQGGAKVRWGGGDSSDDFRTRPRAVSVPRCFQSSDGPTEDATEAAPAEVEGGEVKRALKGNSKREASTALAEVQTIAAKAAAEASKAHAEKLVRKERTKERRQETRAVGNTYAAQVGNAQKLERVWREEMQIAFPNLPQIAWFKREGFKTVARKEGKLAADLLEGYGDDFDYVKSLVECFLQNWKLFGPMLTKQSDSIPTFGLMYACHATVAAEHAKLKTRNSAIEQYEQWQRDNAGDSFAMPPADLFAAYNAAVSAKAKKGTGK
jgi:hypothetical protein